jgi:hypothetical protein
MNQQVLLLSHVASIAALVSALGAGPAPAAEPPRVSQLRVQRVGQTTFFEVCFQAPRDLKRFEFSYRVQGTEAGRRLLARLPALVPQDGKASHIYPLVFITQAPESLIRFPKKTLRFVGRLHGAGKARFLLGYPAVRKEKEKGPMPLLPGWNTVPITVDFAAATRVARPRKKGKRPLPLRNDLRRLWAVGQAARFAVLEAQAPDFGFYTFARLTTRRKYHVRAWSLVAERDEAPPPDTYRLYEMTTGATALTETLQLRRLLRSNFGDAGKRTIDVAKLPGITIGEHPWKKMMGGKKPAPEPLAKLVPNDNYYLRFRNVAKLVELNDLWDRWGTNLMRAYEINSRDYHLRERYEKQLCLKSHALAKTLGPLIIRGLVVTGSDPYFREGTDVTVIFHVVNRTLFFAAAEPFVWAARKEFGKQLTVGKSVYHKITVGSCVSPLREVSLHRAWFGDYVVYSNSPAGVRRVIDTYQGRHKALADSLDFQYMRTVFRADAKGEDGFAFLSDPFIRNLVGPASKIKEKRRLEGLTSLAMTNYAALFAAWENGRLPANHQNLLAVAYLKGKELFSPEGLDLAWDAERKTAVSDVYNTVSFTTPLIELPIDKVTPVEAHDYREFRTGYLENWRRFFDPIGMRLTLNKRQVLLETYILPLIRNSQYDDLRRYIGAGTAKMNPRGIPLKTFAQYFTHISPEFRRMTDSKWLGDWLVVQLGDSKVFDKFGKLWRRSELRPELQSDVEQEMEQLFFQLPLTAGVNIRDPKVFAKVLKKFQRSADSWIGPIKRRILKPPYKGVSITRAQFHLNFFDATLYHAMIGDGWYISFSEAALKGLIDHTEGQRNTKKGAPKGKAVKVNSSLYVAPGAADKAGDFLRSFLEWESHKRALANNSTWYALYRSGLIGKAMSGPKTEAAVLRLFGFVPVSPEGAAYRYLPDSNEVENQRHGSYRRPRLHSGIEDKSPLGQLLREFRTVRADLRFREGGIHTVLTLERSRKAR